MNATDLARQLGVSKARVSQLVRDGTLEGCYSGTGRQRRFDLRAVADRLNRKLDPGQMMGNGARTKDRLRSLADQAVPESQPQPAPRTLADGSLLTPQDPDRYELARIHKAEEEARKLRRQNAEAEGHYVLASEVERQVARQIGQEIAEVETMLREAARRVADQLGVDYRQVRQALTETWRAHRQGRADQLEAVAEAAVQTETEQEQDI